MGHFNIRRIYIEILGTKYEKDTDLFLEYFNTVSKLEIDTSKVKRTEKCVTFLVSDVEDFLFTTIKESLYDMGVEFGIVSYSPDGMVIAHYCSDEFVFEDEFNNTTISNNEDFEDEECEEVTFAFIIKAICLNRLLSKDALFELLIDNSESKEELDELIQVAIDNRATYMKEFLTQKIIPMEI